MSDKQIMCNTCATEMKNVDGVLRCPSCSTDWHQYNNPCECSQCLKAKIASLEEELQVSRTDCQCLVEKLKSAASCGKHGSHPLPIDVYLTT